MAKHTWILGLVAGSCLVASGGLRADLLVLTNGGRIEGSLLNPDESPRKSYLFETFFGGHVTLSDAQVERVVVKSPAERSYEAFLPRVPDTVAGHWDAAQRCEKAGLKPQREFHLEQVLRLEPDHEPARRALGYSKFDGRWIRQQDLMAERGYVRDGGAWRLPQEIELAKFADQQEQVTVEWKKKLRLWSSWIVKGRGKGAEGEAAIRAIRDPEAAPALADQLRDAKEPRPLRILYLDVLAALGGRTAEAAFTQVALQDSDAAIRDRCLEMLGQWKSKFAVKFCIKALQSDQNQMVHRAAIALTYLKDPLATRPLIDALITEHKRVVGGDGRISPTFSNQGSGLSMGGSPKVVKEKVQNEPVLGALTALYPGVNLQYDQAAWRRWYAEQSTPRQISLRRSP